MRSQAARPLARRLMAVALLAAALLLPLAQDAAPTPPARAAEPAVIDLEHNRTRLEQYRNDPEHYARLRRDFRAFQALPPERQKQIRQLDRELHDEESATYVRLRRTLERYVDWLERLPPADRQRIEAAPTAKERVQVIHSLREQEWLATLPQAVRDRVNATPPEQRSALIAQLRQEERRREQEWDLAIRNWDDLIQFRDRPQPSRLSDFPINVQRFVDKMLIPRLGAEEKNRLLLAEGQWPLYPRTLVELADKYLVQLPGPSTGPSRFQELPPSWQERLSKLKNFPTPAIVKSEGEWPTYAVNVTLLARRRGVDPQPSLGPDTLDRFSPEIQNFVKRQLLPVLTEREKEELQKSEGRWPDYPRALRDLARRHDLNVPGTTLPGSRAQWDRFRTGTSIAGLPEVPDQVLLDFALHELTPQEREALKLSFADPSSKDRLRAEWVRRHPDAYESLKQADLQKRQRKGKTGK